MDTDINKDEGFIKDEYIRILTNEQEIVKWWLKYFDKLFNCEELDKLLV